MVPAETSKCPLPAVIRIQPTISSEMSVVVEESVQTVWMLSWSTMIPKSSLVNT